MSRTPARPAGVVRAEAASGPAADLLERVRPNLRVLALEDVLRDGSGRARAADAVLASLIAALRAGDDEVLAALRKAAEQRGPFTHEVETLLDLVRHVVRDPTTQVSLGAYNVDAAGAAVSKMFIDALIGIGDVFEQLRQELPDVDALERARARVAAAAAKHLLDYEDHDLWYEALLRAMLREVGVSTARAQNMTDFIRKRAKPNDAD